MSIASDDDSETMVDLSELPVPDIKQEHRTKSKTKTIDIDWCQYSLKELELALDVLEQSADSDLSTLKDQAFFISQCQTTINNLTKN